MKYILRSLDNKGAWQVSGAVLGMAIAAAITSAPDVKRVPIPQMMIFGIAGLAVAEGARRLVFHNHRTP